MNEEKVVERRALSVFNTDGNGVVERAWLGVGGEG